MSATEELRRMLDERGVEWSDASDKNVSHTTWNDMKCWFIEFQDGWTAWGMSMHGTPEQAIAATLGGGECEMAFGDDMLPECGNCGEPLVYYTLRHGFSSTGKRSANFCPRCGEAVKR